MPFSEAEREIIILYAVWDIIDGMVNYENFERIHQNNNASLLFKTATHQRMFNIILADFLSKPSASAFDLPEPQSDLETDHTYLFYLRRICDAPILNNNSQYLAEPVDSMVNWLNFTPEIKDVFFPTLEINCNLVLSRFSFLKICGNIAKHSFSRLDYDARKIVRILNENGIEIETEQVFIILDEFYDWFHNNIFGYHASAIAEFLNNIRWGIFDYLRPEFERSLEVVEGPGRDRHIFSFNPPDECSSSIARATYWALMAKVRAEPYLPRFQVMPDLKLRY